MFKAFPQGFVVPTSIELIQLLYAFASEIVAIVGDFLLFFFCGARL
mgnify:CR=1 FL=1